MSPTLDSILEHSPLAFDFAAYFASNPSALNKLIDYSLLVPDPLYQNERQCYLYPLRAAQVLCREEVSKLLSHKVEGEYPFIQHIFDHLEEPKLPSNYSYLERIFCKLISRCSDLHLYLTVKEESIEKLVKQLDHPSVCAVICELINKDSNSVFVTLKNSLIREMILESLRREDPGYFESVGEVIEFLKTPELREGVCIPEFIQVILLKACSKDMELSYFAVKICIALSRGNQAVRKSIFEEIECVCEMFEVFESSEGFGTGGISIHILELTKLLCVMSVEMSTEDSIVHTKRLLLYSSIFERCSSLHQSTFAFLKQQMERQNCLEIVEGTQMELFMRNMVKEGKCVSLVRRILGEVQGHPEIQHRFSLLREMVQRDSPASDTNTIQSQNTEEENNSGIDIRDS